jgi:hypothetical protein
MQNGVDTSHNKAWSLLDIQNIEDIPDRFLQFLGDQVGHEWDSSKSMIWNRSRIRDCINRHSYKGTVTRLTDDMRQLGAESIGVTDNASKLLVLSKQGRLSEPDAYMVTADFWHDGAYVLQLVDTTVPRLDYDHVEEVMYKTVPAGTVWYLVFGKQLFTIFDLNVTILHGQSLRTGDQRQGLLGYGQLITDYYEDENTFLSWLPNRQVQKSYYPIVWHQLGITDATLGFGTLGEDVFLSYDPTIVLVKSHFSVYYHESGSFFGLLNESELGYDLTLSYPIDQPSVKTNHLHKLAIFECGTVEATEDSSLYLLWLMETEATWSHTSTKQSFDQVGDFMDIEAQFTQYIPNFSVAQAYLTGDSNLPGNMDEIDGNQGTPDIPLTSYQAALQAATAKSSEEVDWLLADEIDSGDLDPTFSLILGGGSTRYEHDLEYDAGTVV